MAVGDAALPAPPVHAAGAERGLRGAQATEQESDDQLQADPLGVKENLLIRDTPHVRLYGLNVFRMRGSRLWGSRLHRACVV